MLDSIQQSLHILKIKELRAEKPGFDSQKEFLFAPTSRPALRLSSGYQR
jgi:hypothetical protein